MYKSIYNATPEELQAGGIQALWNWAWLMLTFAVVFTISIGWMFLSVVSQ